MIYTHAISALVSGAMFAFAAWGIQGWRMEAQLSQLKTEYATAQAQAVEKAHAETIRLQAKKDEAERKHAIRVADLRKSVAATAVIADGLRNELATARAAMPDASCTSVKRFADTASIVIGECSARLVEVAEQADRAFGEVMFLQDAWPSNVDSD